MPEERHVDIGWDFTPPSDMATEHDFCDYEGCTLQPVAHLHIGKFNFGRPRACAVHSTHELLEQIVVSIYSIADDFLYPPVSVESPAPGLVHDFKDPPTGWTPDA